MEMATQAGPTKTLPRTKQAIAVRKGDIIVIQDRAHGVDRPCRVVERATRTIRHSGQTRVRLSGLDIFTGRKHEALYRRPPSTCVITPAVDRFDVELVYMDGDSMIALDRSGELIEDLTIQPDELRETVKEAFEAGDADVWLSVVCCLGQKVVTAIHGKPDLKFLSARFTD